MILVVGTGRSGTSCVSRILQERLGVDMGGPGRKSESNPQGDYEHRDFRNTIDWPHIEGRFGVEEWRRRAREFVDERTEPWGLKEPRSTYILDLHLEFFRPEAVVWAWRHPEHVAGSMHKWYGGTRQQHRDETARRLWHLTEFLSGVEYLPVDMTERRDEDWLAEVLDEHLAGRLSGYG